MVDSQEINQTYGGSVETDQHGQQQHQQQHHDAGYHADAGLLSAISTTDLMDLDGDMMELFKSDSLKMETFSSMSESDGQQQSQQQLSQLLNQHHQQLVTQHPLPAVTPPKMAGYAGAANLLEHLNKAPTLEEYIDPVFDFNVDLNGEASGKSSWMYSSRLNKVFVKMNQACTFNVGYRKLVERDLYVRAMLVCSAPEDMHQPVFRCENHRGNDRANPRFSPPVIAHVMRCFNPSARYVGTETGVAFQDRLAVIIPLGATIQDQATLNVSLEFVCQNSCRIINRRQTAIIFTLEDDSGQILGKKSVHLKVCSCPKRDKQKEEESLGPAEKRKSDHNLTAPHGKKVAKLSTGHNHPSGKQTTTFIKKENPDSPPCAVGGGKNAGTVRGVPVQLTPQNSAELVEQTATTINVPMPSVAAAVKVAEYAFQVVAGDLVRCGDDDERKHLAAYLTQIRRLQSKYEQFV